MNFVWKCKKCEKEYPSNGEGLVSPVFYSNVLSTRLHSLKCTCGGDVTLCPNPPPVKQTVRGTAAQRKELT